MNEETVFSADLQRDLPNRLQKGLRFNIADGAADFRYHDIGIRLFADAVYEVLDFICDMGNDLNGGAEIFAAALFVQNIPIHLSRGEIGIFIQIFVDKTLIVPKVQVGFRAVLRDIDLAVLIRAHRARVNIDIRVKLLCGDLEAFCLEQSSERGRRDAFSKPGDNAAGYENIFCHGMFLSFQFCEKPWLQR